MSIEAVVLATLVNSFYSGFGSTVTDMIVDRFSNTTPVREVENEGYVLERPDQRQGFAKTLIDGKEALAIYLEKDRGQAYDQARALQEQEPRRVSVEVVGFAQSVWPTESSSSRSRDAEGLLPGASVAHLHGSAGSLGAFVNFRYRRGRIDYKGFTSAAHVLFFNNQARKGDAVISPGRPDGLADLADRVGALGRCAVLTHYAEQNDPNAVINTVDLGTVELDDDIDCPETNYVTDPKKPNDRMAITGVLDADGLIGHLKQPVYMAGRTSGFSEGVLDATSLGAFPMKLPNTRKYLYGELSVVRPKSDKKTFSAAGDSGALVYTADGMAAGFLIGGSPTRSFFQPAYMCLEMMGARLI